MLQQVETSGRGSQPLTAKGWGAFFFPPIFVGTHLEMEAHQKLERDGRAFIKALDTEYKGRLVVVSQHGLVAIAEPARETALEFLNEIMAIVLFRSIPAYSVRNADLVECSIDPENREIARGHWLYGIIGSQAVLDVGFKGWLPKFYHPDNIRSFIKRAESMTASDNSHMDLMLLLETFTQHQQSAYTSAFLLGWTTVVRWLQARESLIRDKGGNSTAGASDGDWAAEERMEMLRLCGEIDSQTYDRMKALHRKWNAIINFAERATSSESEACFHFVLSLLRNTTLAPE